MLCAVFNTSHIHSQSYSTNGSCWHRERRGGGQRDRKRASEKKKSKTRNLPHFTRKVFQSTFLVFCCSFLEARAEESFVFIFAVSLSSPIYFLYALNSLFISRAATAATRNWKYFWQNEIQVDLKSMPYTQTYNASKYTHSIRYSQPSLACSLRALMHKFRRKFEFEVFMNAYLVLL